MSSYRNLKVAVLMISAILVAAPLSAQHGESAPSVTAAKAKTKTRTELLNELSLKQAQVVLDHAQEMHDRLQREFEDSQGLLDKGTITRKEFNEALSAYTQAKQQLEQAKIQLEQTKLGFLANATHITIVEAKKSRDKQGRRKLNLVLENKSNLAMAESALGLAESDSQTQSEWQSPEQIQALLDIENIIVSILNNSSSIGKPYEKIIPILPYGEKAELEFVLLTDVQEAGVKLKYLDQDVIEKIYLEKESLQQKPTVVASQFSQEGQLGTTIRYDVDLEMLVTSDTGFSLSVTNLPPQIKYSFVDSKSSARITSLVFTEEVSKHNLQLQLSIPQKLEVDMIDKTINLQAWAVTTKQAESLNKMRLKYDGQDIPVEELNHIEAGRVDLALIPKGTARLEILINNLYAEIKPQQDVNIKADLHNTGTLTMFNLTPEISPPLGWTAEVSPKSIAKLLPGEKQPIRIHLQPGPEVGVGEYEAQIEARGQSGSEAIDAIEKRLKVRIRAESNITATLILAGGLMLLIVGIVVSGVKLSRR